MVLCLTRWLPHLLRCGRPVNYLPVSTLILLTMPRQHYSKNASKAGYTLNILNSYSIPITKMWFVDLSNIMRHVNVAVDNRKHYGCRPLHWHHYGVNIPSHPASHTHLAPLLGRMYQTAWWFSPYLHVLHQKTTFLHIPLLKRGIILTNHGLSGNRGRTVNWYRRTDMG